jgi:hypothetical protein
MDQHEHVFRLVFSPERPACRKPLVLHAAAITRRSEALFKAMAHDYLLREQFITDPATVLADYAGGMNLPPQRASVSNQLVYAILANRKMRNWLRNYAAEHQQQTPSRSEFMTAFGHAVIAHGDDHAVIALIRACIDRESPFALGGIDQAMLFTSSPVFASGFLVPTDHRTTNDSNSTQNFEHSSATIGTGPGTEHGTEVGTDTGTHSGTNPGTNDGTDEGTDTGTDQGTDDGTDDGTDTGTDQGTNDGTDDGTDTGTDQGTDDGTDNGTDTGTDTGTDPGTDDSDFDPYRGQEYLRVTIEALVQFAITLESRGLLDLREVELYETR